MPEFARIRTRHIVPQEDRRPGEIGDDLPRRNVGGERNDDTSLVDLEEGSWVVNDDKAFMTEDLLVDGRVDRVLGVALDFVRPWAVASGQDIADC